MSRKTPVLLLDFGNVIGFFDHRLGAARMARLLGDAVSADEVYHFYYGTDLEDQHERGRLTSEEVLQRFKARFNPTPTCDDAALAQAFGDIFRPNPPVVDVLQRLPGHIRLVLGSNTNELHYRFFRPMFENLFERFAALVLSFQIGCRKPEAEFYHHCLAACRAEAERVIFFDDREENIRGAAAVGIRAIQYKPTMDLASVIDQLVFE
jgi:putative hydrolase of the HAD superfamily